MLRNMLTSKGVMRAGTRSKKAGIKLDHIYQNV